MARIVVASSTLSGHVLPMVLIGAQLQQLGHAVTLLTDEGHRHVVERAGIAFEPLGPAACAGSPPPPSLNRLLPNMIRRYLLGKADMRSTFIAPLAAQYRALRHLLDTETVDAVLVDLAFTGALPLVASMRPRPSVLVCGVGPLTLTSVDTPPFGMSWIPRPGTDYGGMHAVVNRIMFRDINNEMNAALHTVDSPGVAVPLMDWPTLADRLLQLTVPAFEYPRRDLPANVSFVGPVLPASAENFEPPEWWDDVLSADTVVHVTQGTLDNGNLDQLIAPSLRALADMDGVVVVATIGRREGRRLPSRIPSNARIAEWIPYSFLLPHVDVMITNGGYGGVHQAMSYGIPVVVAGESADKAEVAARVEFAGVGVNLRTANPTPHDISAAVSQAASDCRDAARLIGWEIAQTTALDTIGSVLAEEVVSTS